MEGEATADTAQSKLDNEMSGRWDGVISSGWPDGQTQTEG